MDLKDSKNKRGCKCRRWDDEKAVHDLTVRLNRIEKAK